MDHFKLKPAEPPVKEEIGILACIDKVRHYLAVNYIVDGCRQHRALGCASCQAVEIDRALELLASEVTDNLHDELAGADAGTTEASD